MAEGRNRTSKNLARLAEVFAGFGYRKETRRDCAMADAISLEKDDFGMIATYAELLHLEGDNQEALKQLGAAAKLSSNEEETEQILLAQIKIFQATESLIAKIDELQAELDAGKDPSAERAGCAWLRYYEANRQLDKAIVAVWQGPGERRQIDSDSDRRGAPLRNGRQLARCSRHQSKACGSRSPLSNRVSHRGDQARTASGPPRANCCKQARDLLAASPGNPDVYKFFADLCFQLGDQEEGLEALRRSVRANPSDPQGLISLANALSERARQGEAIELRSGGALRKRLLSWTPSWA